MTTPRTLHAYRHDTKNRALITLAGEIDMESAPLLRESLARCLRDGIRTVDVDLTTVTFCDLSGLNAFLEASLLSVAAGASLRLHHPGPAVSRLFALTGSDRMFRDPAAGPATPPRLLTPYPVTESLALAG